MNVEEIKRIIRRLDERNSNAYAALQQVEHSLREQQNTISKLRQLVIDNEAKQCQ